MTPVARLIARLSSIVDGVPPDLEFRRTYAGRVQREAGAWSWTISSGRSDVFASFSPVHELLRADRLALCPARRTACVDYEVYDAKDVDARDWGVIMEDRHEGTNHVRPVGAST